MTLVTICLPVYNGAEYLDSALESLSGQTFDDMRIIISDNASTDATPEIIASWKTRDSRITSHRQSENIGALGNYNWVLQQADSPWVMFASHDDWWSANYVEELYKAATASPGTSLVAPMMVLIRPDGTHDPRPFYDRINKLQGLTRVRRSLLRVHSGCYYGLYDRQALIKVWNASKRFKYAWGGDFIVLLPFLLSGSMTGSNAAVFYKQETQESAINHKPKTLAVQFDLYRSFLKVSLQILWEAPLSSSEKLSLLPLMLLYTSRHGWKLRRLIRRAIFC